MLSSFNSAGGANDNYGEFTYISDCYRLQVPAKITLSLPLFLTKVPAGFPSPADDYLELSLDLNDYLIKHPAATFMVRASGDSMKNAGIQSGDLLIVDRSLEAVHGKIVIAAIDGELTVKRLYQQGNRVQLLPDNPAYQPITINELQDVVIWGVVTHVIHQTI